VYRTLLLATLLIAQEVTPQCGSTSTATTPPAPSQNVQAIVVNAGPTGDYFNGAFTSVTICVPGSTNCQTVDNVLVDTGSTGLRVLSSVMTLALPQQTATNGAPLVECAQFLDGFTWGPVQMADVKLAGEPASRGPIQVIDERQFPNIPTSCSSAGAPEDSLSTLGVNGILGVGLFKQDCGLGCAFVGSSNPGLYYSCPAGGACQPTAVALANQLQNPVSQMPSDNNGVVISLPAVPTGGTATVTGALIYGIGTQSNNALGSAKVLNVDPNGNITTIFNGQPYASSFLDSGTNGIYFLDAASSGLPLCPDTSDFYCPMSLQAFSTTNRGTNGVTTPALFNIGNADTLNARFSAFNEIGGPNPGGFDFGLGFFFGRLVFTAIEGQTTPGGVGPYFAY
jgi:hypothetical protein